MRGPRSAGFTLLEVLAVIFLTSVVIGMSLDFYVEMSRRTARAAEHTRDIRRASALLDRVARDFEHAVLLGRAPDQDPLGHPWVFLGESRRSKLGADHVKFTTWVPFTRSTVGPEGDLAVVAYLTRNDLDHELSLVRWSSPHLPEGLDRDFPFAEDEDALLLADGLLDFGVRFLGEDGQWTDRWDSSQLVESGELPLAVEIQVELGPNADVTFGEPEGTVFSRVVRLPVRPILPGKLTRAPPEDGGEPVGEQAADEDYEASTGPEGNDPTRSGEIQRSRGPVEPR